MGAFLYRLLLPIGRLVVWIFYRRVEARGADRVPVSGPLIFAANHPNMMMDVLLLSTSQKRHLSFLAKATLFGNPVLAAVLKSAGVLPVYRRSDSPGDQKKNLLTFEACYQLLATQGAIAIFPEGVSHGREAVLPLKTGCARIALEAEREHDYRLGVRILPAGLSFSRRELFRSDALVVFDEPIDPASHFELHRQDPAAAVRALTAELGEQLRQLTRHVPWEEDEPLLRSLHQFFSAEQDAMSDALEVDRVLIDAIRYFREERPLLYSRLRRKILNYGRLLESVAIRHDQVQRRYRFLRVVGYLLPKLALAALGLPIFLYGAVNHWLPYKIPSWIVERRARHPVEVASLKFFSGLVSFPLFYLLQSLLVGFAAGAGWALAYAGTLPPTGVFAIFYSEALNGFLGEVRVFALHFSKQGQLRRLRSRRDELVAELEQCRRDYEGSGG